MGDSEDLVAQREAGDRGSSSDDSAGNIEAHDQLLRFRQAETGEADHVWHAGHEVRGPLVDTGSVDLDQHLIRADRWGIDYL